MILTQITPDFAVSPQIAADDILSLESRGFRAIICNRPDDEDPDQPRFRDIAAAARAAGIEARHVPVTSGQITSTDVAAFDAALAELPWPILAYCRSGKRSSTLWSMLERVPQVQYSDR